MVDQLLAQCRACLVARTGSQTSSLTQLARRMGFGAIETLASRRDYAPPQQLALTYFLVHRHLSQSIMRAVIRSIRSSDDDHIRFSPVILFVDDGPFEQYLQYIRMGFDDVIALPERQPILVQRLNSQLLTEFTYFETADYFGPDRRRMEMPGEDDMRRHSHPHSHVRYGFTRVPGAGIRILKTEVFAPVDRSAEPRFAEVLSPLV